MEAGPVSNPQHICNTFCSPPIHCKRVLASAEWTFADIRRHYRNRLGWHFLRLVPAREADVAQWRSLGTWSGPVEPHHTQCWLLFTQSFT